MLTIHLKVTFREMPGYRTRLIPDGTVSLIRRLLEWKLMEMGLFENFFIEVEAEVGEEQD